MRRTIFLSAASILMMLSTQKANAQFDYDFSAINNGQTIYYNITSSTPPLTVEVTYEEEEIGAYTGTIDIPDSVTNAGNTYAVTAIGDWAFAYCDDLTSVTIPNSVTSIGDGAFAFSTELTGTITIFSSVTSIGKMPFAACIGLTKFDVDVNNPNYSSVGDVLFNKRQDTLLQYPAGKIGDYTIPNTVTTIGYYAFHYCIGLMSITIPNSVKTIGIGALSACFNLTSITIPNSVISIGDNAFNSCQGLTSITIPDSVKTIGEEAFAECDELISVTIGNSVTTIGDWAFNECYSIEEIYVKAEVPPSLGYGTFGDVPNTIPVYVPCGREADYKNAYGWDDFSNIIGDCIGVKDIYMEQGITLYPNPASDNINITLPENVSQAMFTLYDMQGKILIKQEVSSKETVAVNKLSAGVYIYNVRTSKQNYQGKLIRK